MNRRNRNKRSRVDPRAGRARCGARLPSGTKARRSAAQPVVGSVRVRARGADGECLLLPDGTWRRVETLRVRSLFG